MNFKIVKSAFVGLFLSLFVINAQAQNKTVTGKVTDSKDGSAIVAASVVGQGTTIGTRTAADGSFKLIVPSSVNTLFISSVGYASKQVTITGGELKVSLVESSEQLNEVVVIGYGTARKKDVTGAVSSVQAKDFNQGVITTPDQLLQNKVAGLDITSASGQPGAATTVKIRGNNSVRANSNPLYVIDGVPLDGRSARPSAGTGFGASPDANPLNFINPNDIQSVDVLKDASSAAIYGSRGANGVILINTKRGKSGAPTVDYSAYVGAETISQRPQLLNAAEFRAAAAKYKQTFDDNGANTDWLNVITRTAVSQNHNVGVSGGSENLSYRASVGYLDQTGTLIGSAKDRLTGRLNLDAKAMNGKLNMKFNMSASQTNGTFADNRAVGFAMNMRPTDPVYNANGTYFQLPGTFSNFNPLAALEKRSNTQRLQDFLFNASAGYTILDGLVFNVSGTLRTQTANNSAYASSTPGNLLSTVGGNSASRSLNSVTDKQLEATLNWTKKLNDVSTLTLLGGYTYQDVVNDGFGASNNNFLTDAFGADNIGSGLGIRTNPSLLYSYKNEYKLVSFLARAQYSLMNKYFATVNVRRDGSTKFGDNNKWGLFPSVSVGWSLSEEAFLKGNTTIDNLKLRVSWGRTGNSEGIRPLLSKSFYGPSGSYYDGSADDFLPAYAIQSNPNPNLKWEVNENYGAGIDFSILKGKLTGSLDWYTRQTKDLLYTVNAPQEKGYVYPTILANIGSMQNRGIEVSATYQWLDTKDWSISSTFAGSFNQNELISLKNDEFAAADQVFLSTSLGSYIRGTSAVNFSVLQAGQPVGVFYGAKIAKIENGKYVFQDLNGDGVVDPNAKDRTYLGNPNPTFVGGLTTNVRYKAFDLSGMIYSAIGQEIIRNYERQQPYANQLGYMVDRWTGPGSTNVNPRVTTESTHNNLFSSYYVEDGSFARLKNIQLGYSFPALKLKKIKIETLRIYVSANNLITLTRYQGFDPDLGSSNALSAGVDYGFYPQAKTFMGGIQLKF